VRVLCREIFHLLCSLTEPQRLVWWLRDEIEELKIDAVKLAGEVKDGVVDYPANGIYGARIMLGGEGVVEWVEQQRPREAVIGDPMTNETKTKVGIVRRFGRLASEAGVQVLLVGLFLGVVICAVVGWFGTIFLRLL